MIFTLKMLGDISYYLFYTAFLSGLFLHSPAPMGAALVLVLCCGVSYGLKDRGLPARLAPFLALGLWTFMIKSPYDWLALAPAAAYAIYTCAKKIYYDNRRDFKDTFLLFVKIMPVLVAFGLLADRVALETRALPFGVLFLFSSVFMLRMLRHDESVLNSTRYRILDALTIAGMGLAGLAVSSSYFLGMLKSLVAAIYNYIIAPVLMLIAYILAFGGYLLTPFYNYLKTLMNNQAAEDVVESGGLEEMVDESVFRLFGTEQADMITSVLRLLLIAATAIAAFFFFRMIFRRVRGRTRPENASYGAIEERTAAFSISSRRAHAERGPREQVRAVYRKFLALCASSGINRNIYDTSADMLSKARREPWYGSGDADALREIYISARYDGGSVSRDDVKAARARYSAIRAQARKKL